MAQVLYVEDDDELRELFVEYLVDHGFEALGVPGGREALEYLETNPPPRVILLDMMMAPMDGVQFLAELHRRPHLRELPVLVCTAAQQFAREPPDGAARVFLKPINFTELMAALKTLI